MSTHDYVIANASGSAVRSDINNVLAAIVSNNSSSSEPSTKYAYMLWADTTNNVIKLRNAANDGWITLFTTTGGLSISAASTFNEDVTFDGATAGRDMVWDRSDNALEFADNAKCTFGAGPDLSIFHDADSSYIEHTTSGTDLIIDAKSPGDDLILRAADDVEIRVQGNETAIKCIGNGAVQLFYDAGTYSTAKFETTSWGAQVNGNFSCTGGGDIFLEDNGILYCGTGNDLQIYHDGSHSYIEDHGTGAIKIKGDDVRVEDSDGNNIIKSNGSSAELYYDGGSAKFATTSTGAYVAGGLAIGANAAANTINVSGSSGSSQTTLYYGFGTIDLTAASDERVKNNIVPTAKGLDDILKLRIVDFTYTPEYAEDHTTVRTGGIAQEWQKVDTNLVNAKNEDLLFIEYKRVIPHLIKAIQELSDKVTALEAK